MKTTQTIVPVKLVRDAIGAWCQDCDARFHIYNEGPYWGWRRSQALHERTGHRMALYGVQTTVTP